MHALTSLPNVLTGKQVCELIGVSRQTLRRMVRAGTFPPALPTGGKRDRLWSKAAVEEYCGVVDEKIRGAEEDIQRLIVKNDLIHVRTELRYLVDRVSHMLDTLEDAQDG